MDNYKHGVGIETKKDGTKYTGNYYKGKKNGTGTLVWPDKSRYEGQFKDGYQHGEGKYIDSKGNVIKGKWQKGRRVEDPLGINDAIKMGNDISRQKTKS